MLEERSKN
jgi:hypothetical protein